MNKIPYGQEMHTIRLCDGVAKSPYWCQMFADIFNKPIEVTDVTELGCLRAAMFAGVSASLFENASEAVKKMRSCEGSLYSKFGSCACL